MLERLSRGLPWGTDALSSLVARLFITFEFSWTEIISDLDILANSSISFSVWDGFSVFFLISLDMSDGLTCVDLERSKMSSLIFLASFSIVRALRESLMAHHDNDMLLIFLQINLP